MVTLAQIPIKSVVLDIVVTNIPSKFGMFLSRSCCAKLGGRLQMDMYYATIPVYGGELLILYIEVIFMNTICKSVQARSHHIYVVDQDFESFEYQLIIHKILSLLLKKLLTSLKPSKLIFGNCTFMVISQRKEQELELY